ncbi:MAG: hypothetical protein ACP5P9_07165 [Acidimicrobiales bacterium]
MARVVSSDSATPSAPTRRSDAAGLPRGTEGRARLTRGERTKVAIVEAMIDVIESGNPKPTAQQVADQAGVSLRLVFHHFEDLESVFTVAAAVQQERHWSRLGRVPPDRPIDARIAATCRRRRRLFEAITPVRHAAVLRSPRSTTVSALLAEGRQQLRAELAATFAPELDRLGAQRSVVLDAIDLAASWENWFILRARDGRSAATAERVARHSLNALLT